MDDKTIAEMFPASPEMLEPKRRPVVGAEEREVREAFPASPGMFSEGEPGPEHREGAPPARTAPALDPALTDPIVEAFRGEVERWGQAARTDPEFGGANFDATLSDARAVLARYGDDDLRAALNLTGLGNHPSLIRLLARVARSRR